MDTADKWSMAMEDKDWDKLMQMTMNRDFSDVDVNQTDEHGFAALHLCAREKPNPGKDGRCKSLDLMKLLIENGADLNASANADHHTPLMAAVMNNNVSGGSHHAARIRESSDTRACVDQCTC